MLMAPIFTSAMCYGYSKMRESGGASSHLAWYISQAKSKFTPAQWSSQSAASQAKWRSPKQKGEAGQGGYGDADDEDAPEMKFDPTISANAYK